MYDETTSGPTTVAQSLDDKRVVASKDATVWHGLAFIIETLLLMLFLAVCLAIFVQVVISAQVRGMAANDTNRAVIIAQNATEELMANPMIGQNYYEDEQTGFVLNTEVTGEASSAGMMYLSHVVVSDDGEEIYTLNSCKYISNTEPEATRIFSTTDDTIDELAYSSSMLGTDSTNGTVSGTEATSGTNGTETALDAQAADLAAQTAENGSQDGIGTETGDNNNTTNIRNEAGEIVAQGELVDVPGGAAMTQSEDTVTVDAVQEGGE